MAVKRRYFTYFVLIIIVMILGLSSRYFSIYLPKWINLYLGDILWALMIFFLFGFIFRKRKTKYVTIYSFLFSFAIEFSQLYHSQWIDSLRHTVLGGLILGYGFLWSDLVSYSIGISIGVLVEKFILKDNKSIFKRLI